MTGVNNNSSQRNASIFYRLKPSNDFSYENIKVEDNYKAIHAKRVQDCSSGILSAPLYLEYKCEEVFYRQPQREVYAAVTRDVLARAVEGNDITIIAFGQTGSGKTHTLTGLWNSYENTGIIPRFFSEMFDLQSKLILESRIVYKMSYVELIEPAEVQDLLITKAKDIVAKLSYQDRLKNASQLVIPSEDEALNLIFYGEHQRGTVPNADYPCAHCSHTVLTIFVECTSILKSQPAVYAGKIQFVDMMGTNNANSARCHLAPRVQGRGNLAKMLLEQFLSQMNNSEVHTSQNWTSIVLDYLAGSLTRRSILRFIGHMHGSPKDLEATHSTLRFGNVVNSVNPLTLAVNMRPDPTLQEINDKEELAILRRHLEITHECSKEAKLTDGKILLSAARVDHLRRLVESFFSGNVPVETVLAMHQTPLFMQFCKEHIKKMKREKKENAVLLEVLTKEEDEAKLKSKSVSLEYSLQSRSSSIKSTRTRSSVKGLGNKSKESRLSMRAKDLSASKLSKSPRSSEKMKRVSNELKKGKASTSDETKEALKLQDPVVDMEFPIHFVPSRTTAWGMFIVSRKAKELQDAVYAAEVTDRQATEEFDFAKSKVMKASRDLEEARKELYLAQRLRHLCNAEKYTPQGTIITSDKERILNHTCIEGESELNKKMKLMYVQKLRKKDTADFLANARMTIESAYQTYCIANFGAPTSGLGLGIKGEDDVSFKPRAAELLYHVLQNKILPQNSNKIKIARRKSSVYKYANRSRSDD